MSVIKNTIALTRWTRAQNKVNKAVGVLATHGLAYSRTDGIIGQTSHLSARENRKITAAADTMSRNKAGYYRDKQQFTPTTDVKPIRYTALKFADYANVQKKAFEQANESMHLRSGLKFIQRINYDPRMQAHPNRRVLKIPSDEAQEWSALTESYWRDDKESKQWDESLQNNYPQLADMALWSYTAIGEFFAIRRAYFENDDRITNISLQMISPFQVQSPNFSGYSYLYLSNSNTTVAINAASYLSDLPEGNYIEAGIEYNSKNQEIAIFITPAKFGDPWIRIPFKNENGFTQVIHGYIQAEPGQKRGIPESATAWHEFMNIKDLSLFELESARLNSTIAGTVTADSNAQPNGKTPMNDLGGTDPGWDLEVPTTTLSDYEEPSYSVRQVDSGGFVVQKFTPGYQYKELSTSRPNLNIPLFIEKSLEFIYPSISGISVVTVKQRFDGSYNASKGAIDLSWKNGVEYTLKQFTSDWHRPNYEAWLAGKIATGEISAPGWEKPRSRNAWSSMSIITPPKPSLNPAAEATASKTRISEGISNREYESQQTTGTSAEENAERLLPENEKLSNANKPLKQHEIDLANAKTAPGGQTNARTT